MVKVWKNILDLRGIAIVCVVFNHAIRLVVNAKVTVDPDFSLLEKVITLFGITLPLASIAGFMVASGYLLSRFSSNWSAALAVAKKTLVRYVVWSALLLVVVAIITNDFSYSTILETVKRCYGPFGAYWFFPVLLFYTMLCPLLTSWAKKSSRDLFIFYLFLEALKAYFFYGRNGYFSFYLLPLQGSFFILGVLLAQNSSTLIMILKKRFGIVLAVASVSLVIAWIETLSLWNVVGEPTGVVRSSDRASVVIFSIGVVMLLVFRETRQTKVGDWFGRVGGQSLTVFLLFDFFQWLTMSILWHIPGIFKLGVASKGGIPVFLGAFPLIILYFIVGLFGPLGTATLFNMVAGKRIKQFLFG